ncbi:MAG: hypothetical protein HY908_37510 [Myxococcales bacterium]|nr:hypothetical protein [Myxococcales bacterium]
MPAWVPLYPGASPPGGIAKAGQGLSFVQTTSDAPDAVFAHYDKALTEAGFTVKVTRTPNVPKVPGSLQATSADPSRKLTLTVSLTGSDGTTKLLFMTEG